MNQKDVLLVGAGAMAIEYAKVLKGLNVPFRVIGRNDRSAELFEKNTGIAVERGGIDKCDPASLGKYGHAIVAVDVPNLSRVTFSLLECGIRDILVEKPAGLNQKEIAQVEESARRDDAHVSVAYNRRHYASTKKAHELIIEDGGALSFNFEFTEWAHKIEKLDFAPETKANWLLANSSHVIDLAFYLGGKPETLVSEVSGSLPWHPSGAIFSGSGKTENDVLFSYHANWLSAGRWGVEILTKNRRLILRPLEKLFEQKKGEVEITGVVVDDTLDTKYKPGLFREVEEFLSGKKQSLPNIREHLEMVKWVEKIGTKTL